jgi:hypothetical protein
MNWRSSAAATVSVVLVSSIVNSFILSVLEPDRACFIRHMSMERRPEHGTNFFPL